MVTKIFIFVLILSILFIIKEISGFIVAHKDNKEIGILKYLVDMPRFRLTLFGFSWAYIITLIFTGIGL